MDFLSFSGTDLIGWSVGFLIGGFIVGYLIGYVLAKLDLWKITKGLGIREVMDQSVKGVPASSLEGGEKTIQVNFNPMPKEIRPWESKKVYAKGA